MDLMTSRTARDLLTEKLERDRFFCTEVSVTTHQLKTGLRVCCKTCYLHAESMGFVNIENTGGKCLVCWCLLNFFFFTKKPWLI